MANVEYIQELLNEFLGGEGREFIVTLKNGAESNDPPNGKKILELASDSSGSEVTCHPEGGSDYAEKEDR